VVSNLICAVSSRVTGATNSPEALFATTPAVDSLFLFTARPFDPDTQLQNNLNRWYDARVGRWLSEDPIGYWGGDKNLYRYAFHNPVGLIDPNGLVPEYTPDDVNACSHLLFDITRVAWVVMPCARKLLQHFLLGKGQPYCPEECTKSLAEVNWGDRVFEDCLENQLVSSANCDSAGRKVFNNLKFATRFRSGDLHYAFNATILSITGSCSWSCGPAVDHSIGCQCCECEARCGWENALLTDTYDFCSSLPPGIPRRSLAWCGCVLEDYARQKGLKEGFQTFKISCPLKPQYGQQYRFRTCKK